MYHVPMKRGVLIFWGIIIALIVIGIGSSFVVSARPNKLDSFAQCLKDNGTVMYGAFWCPHCQRTKGMFGSAAKYMPYTECSTPDGKGQIQVCKDKGIVSYPTWVFPNGKTFSGEHTLKEISEASGCPLPQ